MQPWRNWWRSLHVVKSVRWLAMIALGAVGLVHAAATRTVLLRTPDPLVSVASAGARAVVAGAMRAWWYDTRPTPWQLVGELPAPRDATWQRVGVIDVDGDTRADVILTGVRGERAVSAVLLQVAPDQWKLAAELPWTLDVVAACGAAQPCVIGQAATRVAAGQRPLYRFVWRVNTMQPTERVALPRTARALAAAPIAADEWVVLDQQTRPRYCKHTAERCEWNAVAMAPDWSMPSGVVWMHATRDALGGRDASITLVPLRPWRDARGQWIGVQQQPAWNGVIGHNPVWRHWQLVRTQADAVEVEDVLAREAGVVMDAQPFGTNGALLVTQPRSEILPSARRRDSQVIRYTW